MELDILTKALCRYLAVINVVTFAVYGIDKAKAKLNAWRVPERVLIGLAAIGGSVGAWCGMKTFRHKTQHTKFKLLIPAFVMVHLLLLYLIFKGRL